MYNLLISILLVFLVLVCLLMILAVLMQRPRSEGLGAAFGGGMTDNLFGAQTTHVLQKFTVWLGGAFFAITLLLAILYSRASAGQTQIQKELMAQPEVPAPTQPATTAPVLPTIPQPATLEAPKAPEAASQAPAASVPASPDLPTPAPQSSPASQDSPNSQPAKP